MKNNRFMTVMLANIFTARTRPPLNSDPPDRWHKMSMNVCKIILITRSKVYHGVKALLGLTSSAEILKLLQRETRMKNLTAK